MIRTSTFLEQVVGTHAGGLLDLRLQAPTGRVREHFVALHDLPAIQQVVRAAPNANVWFGVAPRTTTDGSVNGCGPLTAAFCDSDFKDHAEANVRTALHGGLPPSVVVNTGGGLHAYFLLRESFDLPREKDRAKTLLRRLADAVCGDTAAAEPARILRLPGTRNIKYDPPRPVEIEIFEPGRRYSIAELDEWLPPAAARPAPDAAGDDIIPEGQRHRTMAAIAGALRRKGLGFTAILAALQIDNTARCRPPLPVEEVARIAYDIAQKPAGDTSPPVRRVVLTPLSQIEARPVYWFWQDRLPLGSFVLFGGREGIGKSLVTTTLAADLTRGRLPGQYVGTPKGVIIAATEDSFAHTILPRFMAAGADLDRVFRVDVTSGDGAADWLTVPKDLDALATRIVEADAALVILDPLLSRLDAALDSHKDAESRKALEPLARLADQSGACVLGLIHVNKSGSTDPLSLLMASRAFVAVARAVLFSMVDPSDARHRLLGQPKNNLGSTDLPLLEYQIQGAVVATTAAGEDIWTGQLHWRGERAGTLEEALASAAHPADPSALDEAEEWLETFLVSSPGGRAKADLVRTAGKKAGHAYRTLHRARERLKVVYRGGGFPRAMYWIWPDDPSQSCQPGETPHVGTDGTTEETGQNSPVVPSPTVVPVGTTAETGPNPPVVPVVPSSGLSPDVGTTAADDVELF